MRWRRANRSEEPVPESGAEVFYDWPEDGGAPFDATDDETRWVLVASGRFGRTWPAGDLRDFGSLDPSFEKRVTVGTSYLVAGGQGGERGLDGTWISHAHDTYDAALAETRTMKDRQVLVVRMLVTKHWH